MLKCLIGIYFYNFSEKALCDFKCPFNRAHNLILK